MHFDTEIYAAVEKLGDHMLRAAAQMRRDVKPILGGRLIDETTWMAILVRRAAVARDKAKVPYYDELLEQVEITQFLMKRALNNRYLPPSMYATAVPLMVSVGKQANALRSHFVSAS